MLIFNHSYLTNRRKESETTIYVSDSFSFEKGIEVPTFINNRIGLYVEY